MAVATVPHMGLTPVGENIPMPPEFKRLHWNDPGQVNLDNLESEGRFYNATLAGNFDKDFEMRESENQIFKDLLDVAEWISQNGGLETFIENLAHKWVFASGVGRMFGGDQSKLPAQSVDASIVKAMMALKSIVPKMVVNTWNDLREYFEIWSVKNIMAYRDGSYKADEDSALVQAMPRTSRFKMVYESLRSKYDLYFNLTLERYPILKAFAGYLDKASGGQSSFALTAFAGPGISKPLSQASVAATTPAEEVAYTEGDSSLLDFVPT